jgi:hypothetical protein
VEGRCANDPFGDVCFCVCNAGDVPGSDQSLGHELEIPLGMGFARLLLRVDYFCALLSSGEVMTEEQEIVFALAKSDPVYPTKGLRICAICRASVAGQENVTHEATCPWIRAKAWARREFLTQL